MSDTPPKPPDDPGVDPPLTPEEEAARAAALADQRKVHKARKKNTNAISGRGRGRAPKLTPESQQAILDALRIPMTLKDCAACGGVTYSTFEQWMIKGEQQSSGIYHDFRQAVLEVSRGVRQSLLATWRSASFHDWRAAKALLATSYASEGYVERTRVDTELSGETTTHVKVSGDDAVEELARILSGLAARGAKEEDPSGDGSSEG